MRPLQPMRPLAPAVGIGLLALGLIGIVLPILPGIPLLIAGAFLVACNRPGLRRRLWQHERIRPWVERIEAADATGLAMFDRVRLRVLMFVSAFLPRK